MTTKQEYKILFLIFKKLNDIVIKMIYYHRVWIKAKLETFLSGVQINTLKIAMRPKSKDLFKEKDQIWEEQYKNIIK